MPRILIVEDAEVDRMFALGLLEQDEDMQVEAVGDGKQALDAIEANPPDLVVTDLMMPEMDGLELVETVRERYPLLPVIIMTSRGSEEVAVRALQKGAASYVPKHVLANVLPDTIETVLTASVQEHKRANLMKVMVESNTSFVLKNDRALFRPLIQYVQDTMGEFGLMDEMESMRTCVAVEEALNNAAEHGNLELDSSMRDEDMRGYIQLMRDRCDEPKYRDRRIYFDARFSPSEAVFDIRDEGSGFDPKGLPDAVNTNLEATSGRGITLMRMFMDDVVFNDSGNRVTMRKRRVKSPK